ncbi:MAG TPA: type II secretion system F family protein [Isosphaeraceae bacterium]
MTKASEGPRSNALPAADGPQAPGPRALRARRRQFGLRHIMALSLVLGLVFAAIANAQKTGEPADYLLAGFAVAAAVTALGLTIALRVERWNILGWLLAVLAPTFAAVGASVGSGGGVPIVFGFFLLPVLIGTMVHLSRRLRTEQQETMLWVLALAADRGRPLGPAASALAEQSSGRNRLRLRRVAECLNEGLTLPEALDFVRKSAPAPARLLVRVGHDTGSLVEALRDAASGRSAQPPGWQSFGARIGYLCFVLLVMQAIIGFVLYFIIPKFEAIFKDFGVPLPGVTIAAIGASQWATNGWILPIITVLEWLVLLYLPFAFAGYAEMRIPIIDRLFLRRHAILILRCLAMVVEAGRPIGAGLSTMAVSYPAKWVRERLAGVYLMSEQGHDWVDALRRFGLITRTDYALLESARRAGNLPWALRELADGSARRLGYRLQAIGQIALTLLLLALGAFMGFVAVAYFLPLVLLIERLT